MNSRVYKYRHKSTPLVLPVCPLPQTTCAYRLCYRQHTATGDDHTICGSCCSRYQIFSISDVCYLWVDWLVWEQQKYGGGVTNIKYIQYVPFILYLLYILCILYIMYVLYVQFILFIRNVHNEHTAHTVRIVPTFRTVHTVRNTEHTANTVHMYVLFILFIACVLYILYIPCILYIRTVHTYILHIPYTSDAPQARGLLCNPWSPQFRRSRFCHQAPPPTQVYTTRETPSRERRNTMGENFA